MKGCWKLVEKISSNSAVENILPELLQYGAVVFWKKGKEHLLSSY